VKRSTAEVLAHVNSIHGTSYQLVRRLAGGMQTGAFELTDGSSKAVLKWSEDPGWAHRVFRAAELVRKAREDASPLSGSRRPIPIRSTHASGPKHRRLGGQMERPTREDRSMTSEIAAQAWCAERLSEVGLTVDHWQIDLDDLRADPDYPGMEGPVSPPTAQPAHAESARSRSSSASTPRWVHSRPSATPTHTPSSRTSTSPTRCPSA
jgi:hypothetical protein